MSSSTSPFFPPIPLRTQERGGGELRWGWHPAKKEGKATKRKWARLSKEQKLGKVKEGKEKGIGPTPSHVGRSGPKNANWGKRNWLKKGCGVWEG